MADIHDIRDFLHKPHPAPHHVNHPAQWITVGVLLVLAGAAIMVTSRPAAGTHQAYASSTVVASTGGSWGAAPTAAPLTRGEWWH